MGIVSNCTPRHASPQRVASANGRMHASIARRHCEQSLLYAVAAFVTLSTVTRAQSPPVYVVSGEPACSRCQILLTKVATLGDSSDPVLLTERSWPYRDRRGRYYAWTADP